MPRTIITRVRLGAALLVLTACLTGVNAAASPSVAASFLPTPYDFVSQLDLECFLTDPERPPAPSVVIEHLNPVLGRLPRDELRLHEREQLCAPVAKNDRPPPDDVLEFIRYVDLLCYRAEGRPIDFPLTLNHLNPQLADGRLYDTTLLYPDQFCVPVVKNGNYPPHYTYYLVQYLDLVCYRERPTSLDRRLLLTQLNPVLRDIPPVEVHVLRGNHLCVPVRKDGQFIPDDVLRLLRWVDLEKYDITPHTVDIHLELNHLNPLYSHLPTERAHLRLGTHLMLPVAKNRQIPPRG